MGGSLNLNNIRKESNLKLKLSVSMHCVKLAFTMVYVTFRWQNFYRLAYVNSTFENLFHVIWNSGKGSKYDWSTNITKF